MNSVFSLVLFCLLIPVHAIALPLYIMLAKLGLTNSIRRTHHPLDHLGLSASS